MGEYKLLDIVIVRTPLRKHITLEYFRKFVSETWTVLVSEHETDIILFLEQEQINYLAISSGYKGYLFEKIDDCNLLYITTDGQDDCTDQLFELARYKDLKVNFTHLGGSERLSLLPLKAVMKKLRGPKGCSFDRKQTHESLKSNLIEEAYEVIEAIDHSSSEALCEELGDLLLQIVFHAEIAEERNSFQLSAVIDTIKEKLIRRHPHVFGGEFSFPEGDLNWEEIKKREKQQMKSGEVINGENNENNMTTKGKDGEYILDMIPEGAPALVRAEQIQKRCRKVGFDWDDISGAMYKAEEEMTELIGAYRGNSWEKIEEELGDVLFTLVNISRFLNISAEAILEKTNRKFIRRFKYIEDKIGDSKTKFGKYSLEELDNYWKEAKKQGF